MTSIDTQLIDAIFKLSRVMRESATRDNDLTHLSMLQIQTLVFLKKNPDVQMGEIASNFSIELPSATSLINKLSKANLCIRKADEKDRRLVLIALTKKGELLLDKAMEEKTKKIKDNLSHLSEKDKTDLLRIIDKMLKNYEK
jgi:DNA-binding MarR family transcriptional regulator